MVKHIFPGLVVMTLLSSCTALKSLNLGQNKPMASVPVKKSPAKFIEEISLTPQVVTDNTVVKSVTPAPSSHRQSAAFSATLSEKIEPGIMENLTSIRSYTATDEVETASQVQLKYAVLLNTEVEALPSKVLLESVDDWYGVRYRKGGNTKGGVDCSGFTTAVYNAVYGITLPRVAKEQYRISRKISTTELEEGDLVFFNTTGGISHVGVYLGNSKFIHATVSKGVMVNSLFETYYLKRFIGAGRIDDKQIVFTTKP